MANKYFDSHAHLASFGSPEDILGMLDRSFEKGVRGILNICSDTEELEKTARLGISGSASKIKIYNSFGLHPYSVTQAADFPVERLDGIFADKSFICVGEVGLDYYRKITSAEKQVEIFLFFLEYALSRNLVLCVHCRDAYEDLIRILGEKRNNKCGIIIHCFSGDKDIAVKLERLGCKISFCGNITYPGSGKIREAALSLDASNILAETDTPYLPPQNKRGKKNYPGNVAYICDYIADIRSEDREIFSDKIYKNTEEALGLG
ncbi:MAG: TatD family hydrolase [bacterium]|nr:TatD family hydrolase [bacterium]